LSLGQDRAFSLQGIDLSVDSLEGEIKSRGLGEKLLNEDAFENQIEAFDDKS
jgi:hypothetical protein